MNNKLIILFFSIIFIIPFIPAQLTACSDTNLIDISDIPCLGITNVVSCTGNVSVLNLNTSIQNNLTTGDVGDGRLNFTFDFNQSSYSLVDCANNSATVIVGQFDQGFGISVFFFILPLLTITFTALLVSSKMGKQMLEDESEMSLTENVIHKSRWIPTIIILFSFLPLILMVRIVRGYIEEFLPSSSLVSFFGSFYIFSLYLFFFVSLIFIITLVAEWINVRNIKMGALDKELT